MAEQSLTYQDAYNLLVEQIYAPVFFEKLATDFGIQYSTEDEAREFLVLAGKLEHLDEARQVKQASDRTSFVASASNSLDTILNTVGINTQNPQQNLEVKQAAAQLSQVPYIRNAALLYQDAMRQLMAG